MKIDKLQLRTTIGLIFVIIMYIIIWFLEPKINNQNKNINEQERSRINEVNFSDMTQLY